MVGEREGPEKDSERSGLALNDPSEATVVRVLTSQH